ncbi:integral membrane protein MviN [gamma proteobacterium HTCC5015]|nr:integral membrane protein MviN [gamma proteobacterium HTCC5015]
MSGLGLVARPRYTVRFDTLLRIAVGEELSKSGATKAPDATGEKRGGLFRSTLIFSGMTQLSRILGLLRDILLARLFGADGATDAFFVAFKIPNFFRRLFAEGAFSQAFVPVLTEYKEQRSFNELQALVARTSGTLATVLFVITAVGWWVL